MHLKTNAARATPGKQCKPGLRVGLQQIGTSAIAWSNCQWHGDRGRSRDLSTVNGMRRGRGCVNQQVLPRQAHVLHGTRPLLRRAVGSFLPAALLAD